MSAESAPQLQGASGERRLGAVRTMRTPLRLSTDETPAVRRGPLLGEHSDDVLRDVCGYDDEHIRALRDAAVIGEPAALPSHR